MALGERLKRRPALTALIAVVGVAGLGFGAYWFAPHKALIDERVDEPMPGTPATSGSPTHPGPMITLSQGDFRTLEHDTKGHVKLIHVDEKKLVLHLAHLDTSNGPDLRVLLSTAEAQDDWTIYGKQPFLDLGALKGNIGSSNYDVPDGTDVSKYKSAVIWCRRFGVAFGAAPLALLNPLPKPPPAQ